MRNLEPVELYQIKFTSEEVIFDLPGLNKASLNTNLPHFRPWFGHETIYNDILGFLSEVFLKIMVENGGFAAMSDFF